MSRFEKRITDEQVASAREKIAAGATLRAVAAGIPCAPSTLSYRIKKAEQAAEQPETDARGQSEDWPSEAVIPSGGEAAGVDSVGPLEILREALQASKPSGQPDWATRLSAARTLAALRPQELEPKQDDTPAAPEIVVYDLPPGSNAVIHRPLASKTDASAGETPAAETESPSKRPQPSVSQVYYYCPDEDTSILIGEWSPRQPRDANTGTTIIVGTTNKPETAELWRAELAAGRLPPGTDES